EGGIGGGAEAEEPRSRRALQGTDVGSSAMNDMGEAGTSEPRPLGSGQHSARSQSRAVSVRPLVIFCFSRRQVDWLRWISTNFGTDRFLIDGRGSDVVADMDSYFRSPEHAVTVEAGGTRLVRGGFHSLGVVLR